MLFAAVALNPVPFIVTAAPGLATSALSDVITGCCAFAAVNKVSNSEILSVSFFIDYAL
jgi:hypothetical protein